MTVRRRHVLFLAGFDPKGASFYHGLYRRESARQSRLTKKAYEVGPRQRLPGGNEAWHVRMEDGVSGVQVFTTVEQLRWDDGVRREWPRASLQVAWGALCSYGQVLASGRALLRVARAVPMTLLALAWPGLCWLAALGLALALGNLAGRLVMALWPGTWGAWVAGLAAALGAGSVLALAWRVEQRWNTAWLLRIYRFAERWASMRMPWLEPRLDVMSARLQQVLQDPEVDEVLVVGYSVGSMLAVSVLARALGQMGSERQAPVALLTLGHCVPLLGLMPRASAFRQDLARVADDERVFWVDVSSPGDWGSFALTDPVSLCLQRQGVNPRALVSPRFHTLFEPAHYAQLRRNKRRMHLQYLMSGDLQGDYDFFDLTAGPRCLMEHVWKQVVNRP